MKINDPCVTLGVCDSCNNGKKVPIVTFYHYGVPVLTQCQLCQPVEFNRQAQKDKDSWLSGE
jgi:hypothetical protein